MLTLITYETKLYMFQDFEIEFEFISSSTY